MKFTVIKVSEFVFIAMLFASTVNFIVYNDVGWLLCSFGMGIFLVIAALYKIADAISNLRN